MVFENKRVETKPEIKNFYDFTIKSYATQTE